MIEKGIVNPNKSMGNLNALGSDIMCIENVMAKGLGKHYPKDFAIEHESNFSHLNTHSFKNMVKYISSLHRKGTINDEEFKKLLTYSCAVFIENEFEAKFNKFFRNLLSFFI